MQELCKYLFKPKSHFPQSHEDLGLEPEEFKALSKMFSEPSFSGHEEYVKLIPLLGKNPKLPLHVQYDMVLVSDDMTIQQIIQKWYNVEFNNKENKKKPEDYMLMYESDQLKMPLYDRETILDLKCKLAVQKIPQSVYLRIYEQQYCPFHDQECAMTEQDHKAFEEKYSKVINYPIKILLKEKSYYFYIESKTSITVKSLHEEIRKQLKGDLHHVKCSDPIQYDLWVEKDNGTILEKKLKNLKIPVDKVWKNNRLTFGSDIAGEYVRQFCAPGEIIQLQFTNECFKTKFPATTEDCEIKIKYYQVIGDQAKLNSKAEPKKGENDGKSKEVLRRQYIVKNFSEISKMKISTFLKEHKIPEHLTTCLCLNGIMIRPSVKFEQIAQINTYKKKTKSFEFICVPDNFLFYKELAELTQQNKNVTVDELLQEINKSVCIPEDDCKEYRERRQDKQKQLRGTPDIKQEHKDVKFFDPIMFYTSNLIYWQLNQILRMTSISLFPKQQISQECWHYKTSQRIVANVKELPNFRGTVFRGTSFECLYEEGKIVEWCCFTSTSTNKTTAEGFACGEHPILFEIKAFSGKSIAHCSYFKPQSQILILPYTKFKVLETKYMPKYKYVKLLELPMPKRVPGHALVWVDSNLEENFNYFEQIKYDRDLHDFDLIQLESNDHLKSWLNAYRHVLDMPDMKVHFITNMNRPPKYQKEGIDTLQIIRSFDKLAPVVFFIYGIESKKKDLKDRGWDKDENVFVLQQISELKKIFIKRFAKQ